LADRLPDTDGPDKRGWRIRAREKKEEAFAGKRSKKRQSRRCIFKPAVLMQFHSAADRSGRLTTKKRIRIEGTKPKQKFWVIEEPDGYRLKRVAKLPPRKMTKEEVLQAIDRSKLKFKQSWEEMRLETREP
jgi:hypothetical protein